MPPILTEPYATAMQQAVTWLHERHAPLAIVASGTIVRGTPHAASDLDLVVIHAALWRQRAQRVFNGVPAEMFINPLSQLRRQMARDTAEGRPVMAHMLATGAIVEDTSGIAAGLQQEARANLAAGPAVLPSVLLARRYAIATAFEDAGDLRTTDPDRAGAIVTTALVDAVNLHFLQQGRWLPRPKALLHDLDALDPGLGAQVRAALRAPGLDERLALATPVIRHIAGASGFFAWESEPESLES